MAPRRTIRKYEDRLNDAIQARKFGATYRSASEKFNVSMSTLYHRVNTPFHQKGRRCALQKHEETVIVNFLLRFARRGIPLTTLHLQEAVGIFVRGMTPARRILLPFNGDKPGRAFLRAFRKRHSKKLAFAKPLRQESKRMAAHNAEVLTHHYATLEKLIDENGIDDSRIFNLDECGSTPEKDLSGNVSARRFIPKRGSRDYRIAEFQYLNRITMMPLISADGGSGPPLFVFKGSRLPYRTVTRGKKNFEESPACKLPIGSTLALRAENGGVDTDKFYNWAKSFVKYVEPLTSEGRKVLLIYDAYRAHISLAVLELFNAKNMIVYALPAHTSGKTQPLDTVLFSVFKSSINSVLCNCSMITTSNGHDLFDICGIMKEAYEQSFTPSNIRAGFRRAGIWPLDPKRLLNEEMASKGESGSTILSVDELEQAFEARQMEYRTRVLGSDATITRSGFVDTTNGCVMTSTTVLDLVRKKKEEDLKKFNEEERKRQARAAKEERRRLSVLQVGQRINEDGICRQASLAKMSVVEFVKGRRSLKERRAVARLRTEANISKNHQ